MRLAMIHRATTLGFSERLERVFAYLFFCFSGVALFIFEKNRNVRWHAMQSMLTFGTLFVLMFVVSMLRGILGIIPLLGFLTNFGLGLLFSMLQVVTIMLWLWLMFMAMVRPDYRLPFIGKWVRIFI
jgi:uncharacterized membrane protein